MLYDANILVSTQKRNTQTNIKSICWCCLPWKNKTREGQDALVSWALTHIQWKKDLRGGAIKSDSVMASGARIFMTEALRWRQPEHSRSLIGVSNMWPLGHMHLRVVMNVVQHKIINILKTLEDFLTWLFSSWE